MKCIRTSPKRKSLLAAEEGAVMVEYMSVWAFVIVGGSFAIIKLGPEVFAAWELAKTILLQNKP